MKLIDSPPGDRRPRFRGTGWCTDPGGMTFVTEETMRASTSPGTLWEDLRGFWHFGRRRQEASNEAP